MTLKTRISKLEEQSSAAVEIENMTDLTPEQAYRRLCDGPVNPQPAPRCKHNLNISPEEAYRQMCEGAAKRGTSR